MSVISFNLDQSKVLSSGNGLIIVYRLAISSIKVSTVLVGIQSNALITLLNQFRFLS